jgi:ATP-dependent Clp protease ATP-binding subunit ClpA
MISELNSRLAAKGLAVKIDPPAKRYLTQKGHSAKFGARPLRRVIQDEIEHPIAEGLIKNQYKKGEIIHINTKNGTIYLYGKSE